MAELTIGVVAARGGVGVDTVRYYEKRGLLPLARRRASGYRVFDEIAVARLALIKRLQALGLRLPEIATLLHAGERGAACTGDSAELSAALARTEAQLAALTRTRKELRPALDRCASGCCAIAGDVARVTRRASGR